MNDANDKLNMERRGTVRLDQRGDPRVYHRVGIEINVILDRGFKTKHQAAREVTIEISEGGLRFHDDWGLPEKALLEIVLKPVGSEARIINYGEVRWMTPAADRDAWLAHVNERRNKSSTARLILRLTDE